MTNTFQYDAVHAGKGSGGLQSNTFLNFIVPYAGCMVQPCATAYVVHEDVVTGVAVFATLVCLVNKCDLPDLPEWNPKLAFMDSSAISELTCATRCLPAFTRL